MDICGRPGLPCFGLLIRRFRVRIPRGALSVAHHLGLTRDCVPSEIWPLPPWLQGAAITTTTRVLGDLDQAGMKEKRPGVWALRVYVGRSASGAPLQNARWWTAARATSGGIREAPEPLRRVSWHGGAPLSGGHARRDCRVLRGLTEYSPSEDSMPERPSALFRRLRGFRNEPTRRTNGQQ